MNVNNCKILYKIVGEKGKVLPVILSSRLLSWIVDDTVVSKMERSNCWWLCVRHHQHSKTDYGYTCLNDALARWKMRVARMNLTLPPQRSKTPLCDHTSLTRLLSLPLSLRAGWLGLERRLQWVRGHLDGHVLLHLLGRVGSLHAVQVSWFVTPSATRVCVYVRVVWALCTCLEIVFRLILLTRTCYGLALVVSEKLKTGALSCSPLSGSNTVASSISSFAVYRP